MSLRSGRNRKQSLMVLGAVKNVQDAILANAASVARIDVIDLTCWFRTDRGEEFAPPGVDLAPRQHQRKWKGGRPSAASIASMIREYRDRFPRKAVITGLPEAEADGWAIFKTVGSLPIIPRDEVPVIE